MCTAAINQAHSKDNDDNIGIEDTQNVYSCYKPAHSKDNDNKCMYRRYSICVQLL